MDCLRKRFIVLVISSLVLVPFFSSPVFADYMTISLSPSSGTIYADSTAISIIVNSGTEEFTAIDINLAFTGDVSYMSATAASICGGGFTVTKGTGTINIECFKTISVEKDPYNGVIATLYFKSTGTGSSVFSFTSVDPNTSTKTGGTYTLSTANNPNTGGTLPDSGLFDDARSIVLGGTVLILFGLFFNQISAGAYAFLGKVKEQKVVYEVRKTEKRRGKLEKKF